MASQSHLKRETKSVPFETTYTPPIATSIHSQSPEDIESYFSKPYIPLSSLPTPPLCSSSSRSTSRQASPDFDSPNQALDDSLFGPATHLTNLIPSSTSLTTPSVPLVHSILSRAWLPIEILALAACILDSLNSRFALAWRKQLPLVGQHVDDIHPELIVLSAVIVAHKFLDDTQFSTSSYANEWGNGIWSNDQINFSQRCILENLSYRIAPLWDETIIREAVEDMELAGRYGRGEYDVDEAEEVDWKEETYFGSPPSVKTGLGLEMSTGKAVMGLGDQLTPVETPGRETENLEVSAETKRAFRFSNGSLGGGKELKLPLRGKENLATGIDSIEME